MRLLNQQPLADLITDTVRHLREPAGPAYRTRESIINNREDFIKRFHQGLFTTHACAIDGIMTMESKLETQKGNKGSEIAVKRIIQIFRTLNDALVWTLLARDADYWVARLSRGKPRGRLVDQNPASIIPFLGQVSTSGEKVAIWNDATRCVDLGDVTIFDPKKGLEFAEIKQGKVNEAILETVKTGTVEAIDDFCESFGKRGFDQLQRTVNQQIEAEKQGRLLQTENLIDPFTGLTRVTITPTVPAVTYDKELQEALVQIRNTDVVTLTIDECLHLVLVNAARCERQKGGGTVRDYFSRMLSKPEQDQADLTRVVLDFLYGFSLPTAMPVFLCPFDPDDISRLCIGDVQIYYCFDFNRWGKKLKSNKFRWTSERQGRKERSKPFEQRSLVIDNRVPQVVQPDGNSTYLGGQFFLKLIFQGLRPDYLAATYDEMRVTDLPEND